MLFTNILFTNISFINILFTNILFINILFTNISFINILFTNTSVIKLWDTRRTYSHMTRSPPQAWFTFSLPRIDPKRSYGKYMRSNRSIYFIYDRVYLIGQ